MDRAHGAQWSHRVHRTDRSHRVHRADWSHRADGCSWICYKYWFYGEYGTDRRDGANHLLHF